MAPIEKQQERSSKTLRSHAHILEDLFYLEKDIELLENQRKLRKMNESLATLKRVSGIQDERILQKLLTLKVRPETLVSLIIIPLLEVAWADGCLDAKERKAILAAAEIIGMKTKNIDYQILESWMQLSPEPILFEAWVLYIQTLSPEFSPQDKKKLVAETLHHAREIAEASGGILGLGLGSRRSKKERLTLTKLEKAFI